MRLLTCKLWFARSIYWISSILRNALLACHAGQCKSIENKFVKMPFISQPRAIYKIFCIRIIVSNGPIGVLRSALQLVFILQLN